MTLTPVFYKRDRVTPATMPGRRENYVIGQASWQAIGGSSALDIEVRETDPAVLAQLLERLMFGVRVTIGNAKWQGYIHEVRVPDGNGGEYGVTLEGVGNRIRAVWSGPTGTGTTAFVDDLNAQNDISAVIEYEMQINNADATSALNAVNMELAKRARPLPINSASGAQYARLICRGWWDWFGKEFYSRSNGLYYGRDNRLTGVTGPSLYLQHPGNMFYGGPVPPTNGACMPITIAGGMSHYLDSLQMCIDESGGWVEGQQLDVTLYRRDSGTDIPPGGFCTVMAIGSIWNPVPYTWNDIPLRTAGGARLAVSVGQVYWAYFLLNGSYYPGQSWWLRCADITDTGFHFYTWDMDGGNYLEWDGVTVYEGVTLPAYHAVWYVNGVLDHSTQVSAICTASQFVQTADLAVTTGLQTNPYRDGTQTAMQVLEELSKSGTTNYRRLLYTVEDFTLRVYEEPANTATPLVLDGGQLYQGNLRYWGLPIGHWVRIKDSVLPRNRVTQPDFFMCERATYSEARGWECEARDVESEWSITSL